MNIIKNILPGLALLIILSANGQNHYIIELKSEKWNFKPTVFYISDIVDERADKSNAGKVFFENKLTTAEFKSSLEKDLKKFIDASLDFDSTSTPLILSIERFEFKESGTNVNHKLVLDFSFKFYRILNEKRYMIFESKGKPEMTMHGNYPHAAEKIISQALETVFRNFNEWINQHSGLPPLATGVKVIFDDRDANFNNESSDTILWKENYKLKWKDFHGSPDITSYMAQSNCFFSFRAEPKMNERIMELHIQLNAGFDRKHSCVKPYQQKDTLLAHEQLHFDICELNIRHLKKLISEENLDPMEYDKKVNELFNQAWNDYQLEQQKYDDNTGHGIIAAKQLQWEKNIHSQLENTIGK